MTDNLILPPGHRAETRPDGVIEVVATNEAMTRTLAFRMEPSRFVALMPFFDSFPDGSYAHALRWLLEHPEVKLVMAQRVADSRQHVATGPSPTPSD